MKSARMLLILALLLVAQPVFADLIDDAFQGSNDMTSRALGLAKVIGQIANMQMQKAQRDPLLDKLGLTLKRLYQVPPGDVPGVVGNADDMAIGEALETYATSAVGYGAAMVKLVTGRLKDLDARKDPRDRLIVIANFVNKLIDRIKLMLDTDDMVRAQFNAAKIDDTTTADQILSQYAQIAQAIIMGIPKDTLVMVSAFKINALVAEIIKRTGLVVGNSPCEVKGNSTDQQAQAAQDAETKISGLFKQSNAAKPQDYAGVVGQIIMGLKSDWLNKRRDSNDRYKVGDNPYQSYFEMIAADKILLGWITPPAVPDKVGQGDVWQVDVVRMPGDSGPYGRFWSNQGTLVQCHPPAIQAPDKMSCICPTNDYLLTSNAMTDFNLEGNPTLKDYMCTRVGTIGTDAGDGYFWNTNLSQQKCVGTAWRTPDRQGCGCTRKYDWYTPKLKTVSSDTVGLGVLKIGRAQLDCAPMTPDDFLDAQEKGYCVNQHNNVCVQGRMFEGITEGLKVAGKWSTWTDAQKQRAVAAVKKILNDSVANQYRGLDTNRLKNISVLQRRVKDIALQFGVVLGLMMDMAATGDQDAYNALVTAAKSQLTDSAKKMMQVADANTAAQVMADYQSGNQSDDPLKPSTEFNPFKRFYALNPSEAEQAQSALGNMIDQFLAMYPGDPYMKDTEKARNWNHAELLKQYQLLADDFKKSIGAQ
jgi:hypothetical protein